MLSVSTVFIFWCCVLLLKAQSPGQPAALAAAGARVTAAAPSQDGDLIVAHASGTAKAVHKVRIVICQVHLLKFAISCLHARNSIALSLVRVEARPW